VALREWGVHVQRPVSPAEVAALELAAIDVVTVPLSWRWMEASPGVLDMSAVRHLLAPFSGSALRLQGVLGPAMPHNLPDWVVRAGGVDAPEFTSWFSSYCARAAAELPELKLCRIEDELNAAHPWETLRTRRRRGRSWRRASFRRDLLLASCAAVRSARPEIELRVTLQTGTLGW